MKNIRLRKIRGITVLSACLILISGFFLFSSQEQMPPSDPWEDFSGCTSIQVGRLATTDGSVITAHSCDGNYRQWLNMVPHAKHPKGAMNKIYTGKMHTETSWDLRRIMETGEIPQVAETYAFLNVAYPCLNEHQLAIGETTIGGRRELYNSEGIFMIEEIERVILERCKTARDAIKLAGELIKNYGYGDRGECITIADSKEIWHFEVFGEGPLAVGGVWAAQRIPDEHVGVSANIPRIGELNLDDPDHFMASENVFKIAEEMGWWDPDSGETFKFWEAYSGRRPFSTREFFILSTMAPSLNLSFDAEELPFSVKPDKKVSVRDVMKYYRQTYAGTDLDMTRNLMVKDRSGKTVKSPLASPFMSRDLLALLNSLKPGVAERQRTIAIAGCSYCTVLQCRDWLPAGIGGICWFAFDNPGESARIPIFAGVTELLPSFEIGAQHRFRTDSAAWAFRRANRLATIKWGQAGKYIEEAIQEFEDKAFAELPQVEKKALELYKEEGGGEKAEKYKAYLTSYTNDFARAAIHKYWELGDKFWAMFARGF